MSFRQFLREKDTGFKSSSYLLYGSDEFFLKEAERNIKEGMHDDQKSFGLDIYDLDFPTGKLSLLKEIVDSLNTFSFFSENKVVIVRNAQKIKKAEMALFKGYLDNPSDSSTLFIFYNDRLNTNKKDAFRNCKIISLDHNRNELREWISSYAGSLGISLSAEVTAYLIGMSGDSAGLLASEVNKLSLTGKDKIGMEDLRDIFYGESGVDTFELTRAISSGNSRKAFALASRISGSGTNMLLGAINWQISRNKDRASQDTLLQYYRILLEADTINKSTGAEYPLELLITKLLYR